MQRLNLLNCTNNSVVATATWCSLHAHEGDCLLECIGERMKSPRTTHAQRTALVYVLHELLLTCSRKGVAIESKQMVLLGVRQILPTVLKVVLGPTFSSHQAGPKGEDVKVEDDLTDRAIARTPPWGISTFIDAVEKCLEWWKMLQLFSPPWLEEVREILRQARDPRFVTNSSSRDHNSESPSPSSLSLSTLLLTSNIQRLAHWLQKYEDLKERLEEFQRLRHQAGAELHASESMSEGAEAKSAVESAVHRCLDILEKIREKDFPNFFEFQQWCQQEKSRILDGHNVLSRSYKTGATSPFGHGAEKAPQQPQAGHYSYPQRDMPSPPSSVKKEPRDTHYARPSGVDSDLYSSDYPSPLRIKQEDDMYRSNSLRGCNASSSLANAESAEEKERYAIGRRAHESGQGVGESSSSFRSAVIPPSASTTFAAPLAEDDPSEKKKEDDDDILGSFF